ncbi:MAG: vWA domain-containing protein [Lachnospiraceae bacterium]
MTELVFILDRSGSMAGLESDTIGGYNAFLQKQKKQDGECRITTVLFDNQIELLHDRIDLPAVRPLTEQDYQVGGCTALNDAIGLTVSRIGDVQKRTAEEYRAGKVLFVIITDGLENASRRYSTTQVRAMIRRQKEKYHWEFVFLGANMDAAEQAEELGIGADRAADYAADPDGTELNFRVMSEAVSSYRQKGVVPDGCLEEIRRDAKSRKKRK